MGLLYALPFMVPFNGPMGIHEHLSSQKTVHYTAPQDVVRHDMCSIAFWDTPAEQQFYTEFV